MYTPCTHTRTRTHTRLFTYDIPPPHRRPLHRHPSPTPNPFLHHLPHPHHLPHHPRTYRLPPSPDTSDTSATVEADAPQTQTDPISYRIPETARWRIPSLGATQGSRPGSSG